MCEIIVFLQDHNIGIQKAYKIYKIYGDNSIAKIQENPYNLSNDISGIGFKTADQIAQKFGLEKNSEHRILAALAYSVEKAVSQGDTYTQQDQLVEHVQN